ncbi:MAG: type II secretion system ATPase GspE [Nitrospirota bacterium]
MPLPQQKKKMLGEMLLAEGVLSQEQLERALSEQKRHGGRVGTILKSMGFVTEDDIIKVLGKQMGIQHLELSNIIIDPEIVKMVPETVARRYHVVALYKKENILTLAMVDPLNIFAIDEIRDITGLEIQPVVSKEDDVLKTIERYYSVTSTIVNAIKDADITHESEKEEVTKLEKIAAETPVIKLVNTIISQAVRNGGSDIHIEPDEDILRVRNRVDGILSEMMTTPINLHAGVTSRIKIMANLNISEKRVPQDGRIQTRVGNKDIDLRVSTLPTVFGEKIVMRILDKSSCLINLDEMGFSDDTLIKIRRFVKKSYGLFLVTGPTGSGKTTTLYAALNSINSIEKNIVTIEDPVEYQLKLINQIQVNPKVGVTFATGLRAILRQDPDIVMVGEIRDRETATIAIQAALTGHLVFSTLHTNDSAGAVARLVDMGVEPFLLASSLICVIAQRLIRRVCKRCKTLYIPAENLIKDLGIDNVKGERDFKFMRGEGCQECRNTGHSGRIGIYECLVIDDAVRNLIISRSSSNDIRSAAKNSGFATIREDGIQKATQGITSIEEVLRVTQEVD